MKSVRPIVGNGAERIINYIAAMYFSSFGLEVGAAEYKFSLSNNIHLNA